jgi:hypothetical protein
MCIKDLARFVLLLTLFLHTSSFPRLPWCPAEFRRYLPRVWSITPSSHILSGTFQTITNALLWVKTLLSKYLVYKQPAGAKLARESCRGPLKGKNVLGSRQGHQHYSEGKLTNLCISCVFTWRGAYETLDVHCAHYRTHFRKVEA